MAMGKNDTKENIIESLLIENYQKYYYLAYRYVHNEADALDIVQEGAYKAILKCDTLNNQEYAATWIYRIMLNEIFGFCRSRKRKYSEEFCEAIFAESTYDYNVNCIEEMDLRNALEKLSSEEKTILELRYFRGMKLDEVSKVMNINLSTAKSKLYRTIDKLRISMST